LVSKQKSLDGLNKTDQYPPNDRTLLEKTAMPNISLTFDTEALAEYYEEISVDRQFKAGKNLLGLLAPQPGAQVLDVGTGTGLLAEYTAALVEPGGSVIGIDPLPLRIQLAKRKSRANLSFAVGDATDLAAFAAARFDIVYLNAVFHWIADKPKALTEIFRVLKHGGRLGISTGSKDHPNLLQTIKAKVLARATYAQHPEGLNGGAGRVSAAELEVLFTEAGLTTERIDVQPNVHFQPSAAAAIEFSQTSSFGNLLGHLPVDLQASAQAEIERELDALKTPEGIRFENARIIAIAVKP
jgi:ubiquinone/menaquinone biosynthesis C-methylase UbiE